VVVGDRGGGEGAVVDRDVVEGAVEVAAACAEDELCGGVGEGAVGDGAGAVDAVDVEAYGWAVLGDGDVVKSGAVGERGGAASDLADGGLAQDQAVARVEVDLGGS